MTQNYARPMHAMPSGIPVIPPRMHQQQQQELIQQHRRQQQMQVQQLQHMQQRQQMQGMNHARSVSSGSNRADPRPLNSKASSDNLAAHGRRLRSESNPAHSSHHQRSPSNGTSVSQGLYINTSAFVVGHSRTNSNSDNSNSSSASSYSPRSQSRALTHSPSTATRSNTTGSSFQERMRERDREKQQREREERDAAARAILDDPKLSATLLNQPTATTTAAAAAQSTGTAIWNRLRAAKDVINATITGEERWPDSDDSDHEGESHVSRMLREYVDKKETAEVAAKIAELEMTHVSSASSTPLSSSGSLSKSLSSRGVYRQPPDTTRYDNGTFNNSTLRSSPSATSLRGDYYGQSVRSRGEPGHQPAISENCSKSAPTSTNSRSNNISDSNDKANSLGRSGSGRNGSTLTKSKSSGGPVGSSKLGNRFRTSSDASLSEALGRLEGKRNQDALVAQVSHLGSTRARSPHRAHRAHLDNVDEVPPPPLPTPKSSFRQHAQNSEQLLHSSPSRRGGAAALAGSNGNNNNNADLGAYGQHLLLLQQKQ